MHRTEQCFSTIQKSLLAAAIVVLIAIPAVLWLFDSPAALAQSVAVEAQETRHYVGSQECAACHRDLVRFHAGTAHGLALTNVEADASALLADFSTGADIRTILLPGETEARPFTADDVSHAIGSGKYAQRYLYRLTDETYLVLPAEWNTLTGEWQPFVLSESWPSPAYDWTTQCAGCHTTNLDVEQGLWMEDGVQCEACHGPGSAHLDAGEATERILTPRQRTALDASIELGLDAAVCGQCHSQGTEPQSGYPFPLNYQPGDVLLDRDVFRLPGERSRIHWWRSGQASHPNMQFNEWVTTAHAEAFQTVEQHPRFVPGCLSCHNVTYARAAQLVERIEAQDDRERMDVLFREAGIRIADIYRIDWDRLKALTVEALELDAASIRDAQPFLPQILPTLIERMHAAGELADGQILPRALGGVLRVGSEGADDDHTSQSLGVTCAACHNPHSMEGHPASLRSEPETLCAGCHRSAEPIYGLHHPVQEVFEGHALVAGVTSVLSAHFAVENGPTCATCHMPQVPVEHATRVSHTLAPVLPADVDASSPVHDSCTGCHGERVSGQTMQELIDVIQNDTRARYTAVRAALDSSSPAWITDTLQIIEGDGSWGFHNYGYVSALLRNAESELGLREPAAPLVLPDIPVQPAPQVEAPPTQVTSPGGLTTPSIILLAIAGGLLLISAYLFLVRGRDQ